MKCFTFRCNKPIALSYQTNPEKRTNIDSQVVLNSLKKSTPKTQYYGHCFQKSYYKYLLNNINMLSEKIIHKILKL